MQKGKMLFFFFIVTALTTATHARTGSGNTWPFSSHEIDIDENGAKFKEKVVTFANGDVIEETPAHNHNSPVKVLSCPLSKQRAIYNPDDSTSPCLVSELLDDEPIEQQMLENNVLAHKAHMKKSRNEIIKTYFVIPTPIKDYNAIDPMIIKFCGDRQLRWAINTTKEKVAEIALNLVKETSLDDRKRVVVKEFVTCDSSSSSQIDICKAQKKKEERLLSCVCSVRDKSCTYKVSCPLSLPKQGFNCNSLHVYNHIVCCDFKCNKL